MSTGLKFLRPYLCKDINITKKSVYVRFYHNTKCMAGKAADATISTAEESRVTAGSPILPATILSDSKTVLRGEKQRISVNERIEALQHAKALSYPRIERDQDALTIKEFEQQYNSLEANNLLHNVSRTVRGRLRVSSRNWLNSNNRQAEFIVFVLLETLSYSWISYKMAMVFK